MAWWHDQSISKSAYGLGCLQSALVKILNLNGGKCGEPVIWAIDVEI